MKYTYLLFILVTICTNSLMAQESKNYLNIISNSLPEEYLKPNEDLYFTIQVGAFRNKNIILEKINNIIITQEDDNITKYRLGAFLNYKEANSFKKIVLSVCNDAFIVPIKNGKRVHIKEALKKGSSVF